MKKGENFVPFLFLDIANTCPAARIDTGFQGRFFNSLNEIT